MMSVTSLQLPPVDTVTAEKSYLCAIESLGLEQAPIDERVKKLLRTDGHELRTTLQAIGLAPTSCDSFPLQAHSFADIKDGTANLGARKWCDSIMIGDCQFDGSIFGLRLASRQPGIAEAFCSSIQSSFRSSPAVGEALLNAYNLSPDMADAIAFERILEVGTDLCFYAPTFTFAEGLHGDMKVFVYRFNEPNPWEGPWKGRATHGLDVALLLQNFGDYLEPEQRRLGEELADNVFNFLQGEEPWDEWRCQRPMSKTFGPKGECSTTEDDAETVGRRSTVWRLAETAEIDALVKAYMIFLRNGTQQRSNRTTSAVRTNSLMPPIRPGADDPSPSMRKHQLTIDGEDFIQYMRNTLTEELCRHVRDIEREMDMEKKRHQQVLSDLADKCVTLHGDMDFHIDLGSTNRLSWKIRQTSDGSGSVFKSSDATEVLRRTRDC